MKINEIRALIDKRNETIGRKIRDARSKKYPYMLIIGEKEMEDNLVAVRHLREGDLGTFTTETFIEKLSVEIKNSYSFKV